MDSFTLSFDTQYLSKLKISFFPHHSGKSTKTEPRVEMGENLQDRMMY